MLDDLRALYQEVILDHGRHPRNFRHPEATSHMAEGYNPLCGDQLKVYLVVGEDGRIKDAAFEGKGCAISIASASMMTEILHSMFSPTASRTGAGCVTSVATAFDG